MTSLLVSASLVLGILVSDLCGYRLLTAAHAENNPCTGQGKKVSSNHVKISNGRALGGIVVRGVTVNGQVIEHGVIMGSVLINDMTAPNARGVLVGDGDSGTSTLTSGVGTPCRDGVLVGDDSPSLTGVLVGDDSPASLTGVLVGDDSPSLTGVLVGDDSPTAPTLLSEGITVNGAVVSIGGTANGGVLVGDDIRISDGIITGQNLVLTGATVKGGPVNIIGSVTEVQVSPAN